MNELIFCEALSSVVDGQLVTSRQPSDIPAFNREMIALFAKAPSHVKAHR